MGATGDFAPVMSLKIAPKILKTVLGGARGTRVEPLPGVQGAEVLEAHGFWHFKACRM